MTTSIAERVFAIAPNTMGPPSMADNAPLMALNLFLMTAAAFLGAMMAGKQARRIWACRVHDHPTDPVTLYRLILLLAGCAIALRGGAEAVALWSWSSHDPNVIARVASVKRWIDPISVGCGFTWMAAAILGEPMIEHQLRKAPLPVDMWSRWAELRRPAGVVALSLIMAGAAVVLR